MDDPLRCHRRAALRAAWLGLAAAATSGPAGCARVGDGPVSPGGGDEAGDHVRGRLSFRPGGGAASAPPTARERRTGSFDVEVDGARPAAVHVPDGPGPLRLVVVLHGAGGVPARTRELLLPYADEHRLLLVAPASRRASWDVVHGGLGPDVRTIDTLLQETAAQHPVSGFTVAGFSDGASYALTLGIANGDVFDSVVAFSPGFAAPQVRHGQPRFFVSHGTGDRVLPIEACSRRLVPALRRQGYDVTYEEFDGGHHVPRAIRQQAVGWLGG